MKYVMFAALSMFSVFASANGAANGAQTVPQATEYTYSQKLDIAKVISMTSANDTANECGLVEAHMVYVDSKGATHNLEYTRLGDGCQNG